MSARAPVSAPPSSPVAPLAFPWLSIVLIAAALGVAAQPNLDVRLLFDRAAIARGEFWRLWTGHFVHFGASHLAWNLAVFALAALWAERLRPFRTRVLLMLAPGGIGLALYGLEPRLFTFGGLSGLATALLAFLAFTQLARQPAAAPADSAGAADAHAQSAARSDRWFWRAVLALIVVKIGLEFAVNAPLFARFASPGIRTVPLAHLVGVLAATMVHRFSSFRPRLRVGSR